jgi:transcriptional regulator with XRE-family HTH domain
LNGLGDHLRKRRLDLGLLQREVADKIGVHKTTIHNWETIRTSPQLRLIPRIIAFLSYCPYNTESGPVGKRIVARREATRLSKKQLARPLGADPSTLGRWEKGKTAPSRKHRETLLAFPGKETLVDREP